MKHTLPLLPYALDALEPHLSRETMEYHYGKHHLAYLVQLNALIQGTAYEQLALEDIAQQAPVGGIFNNAAQALNHTFFWHSMKPKGGGLPQGALAHAVSQKWGTFDQFKQTFLTTATGNFGSGWTWLVKSSDGTVDIVNTSNAATLLIGDRQPLFVVDVWEHAYYIDWRNQRAKFVEVFLSHLVNWDWAEQHFG
jgi:superoxide dismutase, Fe-Mn family